MPAVAAIASVALAAGGTAYGISEGNKARQQAADQAKKQEQRQAALTEEQKRKEKNLEAQAFANIARSQATSGLSAPKQSIGSPGLSQSASQASKTLIGS